MLPFLAEADVGSSVDMYWKGFQVCAVLLLWYLFMRKLPKTVSDEVKRHTGYPSDHNLLVKVQKRTSDMSRRMGRLQERVINLPGDIASSIAEDLRGTIREDIGGIIDERLKVIHRDVDTCVADWKGVHEAMQSLDKAVKSRYDTFLDDWQKTALSLSNIELSLTYVRAGLSGPVHSTSDGAELPEGNLWKSIENLRSWLQDDFGSTDNLWTKLNDIHQWTGWQHDVDEAVKKAEDALFEESNRAASYEVLVSKVQKLGEVYSADNAHELLKYYGSVKELLEQGVEAIKITDHLIHNQEKMEQKMEDAIIPELWDANAEPQAPVAKLPDSTHTGFQITQTEKLIPDELTNHPDVGLEQNERLAPDFEPECGKCGVRFAEGSCLCPKDQTITPPVVDHFAAAIEASASALREEVAEVVKPHVSEKDCDEYLANLPEGVPTESSGLAGFRFNVDKALMDKAANLRQDIADALKPVMEAFRVHGDVVLKMGDQSIHVVKCAGCGKMVEKKEGDCEPYFCGPCEFASQPMQKCRTCGQNMHESSVPDCLSCIRADLATQAETEQSLIETEDDIELAPIIESDDDVWIGPLTPWTNGEHLVMARSSEEAVEIAQAEFNDTLVTKSEDWNPVPGGNGEKLNVRYSNGITFEGTVSSIAQMERGYVGTIVQPEPDSDLLKEAKEQFEKDVAKKSNSQEFKTTLVRLAKQDLERVERTIRIAGPIKPNALLKEQAHLQQIIADNEKED